MYLNSTYFNSRECQHITHVLTHLIKFYFGVDSDLLVPVKWLVSSRLLLKTCLQNLFSIARK